MVVFNSREKWNDWVGQIARYDSFQELERLRLAEVVVTAEGWRVLRNHALADSIVGSELAASELLSAETVSLALNRGESVAVSFSSDLAFSHTFLIPRAARNKLAKIVELERTRVTPFSNENSISYFTIADQPGDSRSCETSLLALRHDVLAPIKFAIEAAGAKCAATFIRDLSGRPVRCAMAPDSQLFRAYKIKDLWKFVGYCSCAALLGFTLLFAAIEISSNRILLSIENDSQSLQADALLVRKSIEGLKANSDARQALFAEHDASVRRIQVLEEMSRLLPEDAFLVSLSVRQGQGSAEGYASAPESLISLLEASPVLKNVQFNAPVVKNPSESKSSFSIKFDMEDISAK